MSRVGTTENTVRHVRDQDTYYIDCRLRPPGSSALLGSSETISSVSLAAQSSNVADAAELTVSNVEAVSSDTTARDGHELIADKAFQFEISAGQKQVTYTLTFTVTTNTGRVIGIDHIVETLGEN